MSASAWAALLPPSWKETIARWIAEDAPSFDYGGFVVGDKKDVAVLWGKSPVRPHGALREPQTRRSAR